jgi:hypothetical protein
VTHGPRGHIVGVRERLNWHHRFTLSWPSQQWGMLNAAEQCCVNRIDIMIVEASGIDLARANDISLVIHAAHRPMHRTPLASVCVADSVLEARVAEIEKLIAVLMDTNKTEMAQIASVFGARRDHVDHRRLMMPVSVNKGELFGVRLDRCEHEAPGPGPYRIAGQPTDTIHVDLFGIDKRDTL